MRLTGNAGCLQPEVADVVDPATRSRMMAGIGGRNTKPELLLRRELHRRGLRYRLHRKDLAGRPDVVFPKYGAVLFVHGCFWHGHDCRYFKWPSTRPEFWAGKIASNRARDKRQIEALTATWRVGVVWECALRGKNADVGAVVSRVVQWLEGDAARMEERG